MSVQINTLTVNVTMERRLNTSFFVIKLPLWMEGNYRPPSLKFAKGCYEFQSEGQWQQLRQKQEQELWESQSVPLCINVAEIAHKVVRIVMQFAAIDTFRLLVYLIHLSISHSRVCLVFYPLQRVLMGHKLLAHGAKHFSSITPQWIMSASQCFTFNWHFNPPQWMEAMAGREWRYACSYIRGPRDTVDEDK